MRFQIITNSKKGFISLSIFQNYLNDDLTITPIIKIKDN